MDTLTFSQVAFYEIFWRYFNCRVVSVWGQPGDTLVPGHLHPGVLRHHHPQLQQETWVYQWWKTERVKVWRWIISILFLWTYSLLVIAASGRALAVKPDDESLYLIGTEEGMIHLCTTEFASQYLRSYQAHTTPVYNIQWNPFLSDVFISCAAEWNIKIWDIHHSYPLYTFDVDYPAGDVAWAPYSRSHD